MALGAISFQPCEDLQTHYFMGYNFTPRSNIVVTIIITMIWVFSLHFYLYIGLTQYELAGQYQNCLHEH